MENPFILLGLCPKIVQSITQLGYNTPTEIQSSIILAMLAGRDIIGQSQTGSGKTAAFGLPIIQNLTDGQKHIQCLILVPTRELALQVKDAVTQYGCEQGRVLAVYGGQPYAEQIRGLKKGADVVVGTPGRILDLIGKKYLNLDKVSWVILDEADEMLSMGFLESIESILEITPPDRHTGLFSATIPAAIRNLASRYQKDPLTLVTGRRQLTVQTVEQRYYVINETDRLAALTRLFETEPIVSALVFSRTRIHTGELANELVNRGFAAEALNGDLSQEARERVLQRFRNNQIKVLVATDVAARGLDIDHVSHVFNYDLPQDLELYVHRIGRTGRAGKNGVAVTLLTPKERWFLRKIESFTKQKMTQTQIPSEEDIHALRDKRLVERMGVWLKRDRCKREQELVSTLVEEGYDAAQIAAAALKLIRAEEKQRPIAAVSELKEETKTHRPSLSPPLRTYKKAAVGVIRRTRGDSQEKGMVRISLSGGKAEGLSPGHIVGSLSHHAGIPGNCIGRISIEERTSFVDIPEQVVNQVLARTDSYRIGRHRIAVSRA